MEIVIVERISTLFQDRFDFLSAGSLTAER